MRQWNYGVGKKGEKREILFQTWNSGSTPMLTKIDGALQVLKML